MYLVVGLGNPEVRYLNTYHNLGFRCVEVLADILAADFVKSECRAETAHTRVGGEKVILAKPQTYMNLSGESVAELVHMYKIPPENVVVVYDDFDLPLGSVRFREKGSSGTHNGMRNIVERLGTENFARVRIGIGKETPSELYNYVLSQIADADKPPLNEALKNAAGALSDFLSGVSPDVIARNHNTVKKDA